jgi:hypothetical protein
VPESSPDIIANGVELFSNVHTVANGFRNSLVCVSNNGPAIGQPKPKRLRDRFAHWRKRNPQPYRGRHYHSSVHPSDVPQ